MKSLKKLLTLLCVLLLSSSLVALEKEELSLEDRLTALEAKASELVERLASFEKSSEPTYEKCDVDGTNCKKITPKKASTLVRKNKGTYKVKQCHGNRCNWMAAHGTIQGQFQELQKKYGITPISTQKISEVTPKAQRRGLTQKHFNILRKQINQLLADETSTKDAIEKKINEFEQLNPARRPSPNDYRELLKARFK